MFRNDFVLLLLTIATLPCLFSFKNVERNTGGSRIEKATKFYQDSQKYISLGNMKDALAALRTAVRLDNSSYLYWNDLGVTELRFGQLAKAYKRFLRAYEINPDYEITLRNMNDIEQFVNNHPNYTQKQKDDILNMKPYYQRYPKDQRHRLKPIPAFSKMEFEELLQTLSSRERQGLLDKPFLVKGLWQLPPDRTDYLQFESLLHTFQGETVKVDFYPHNMLEEQTHPLYTSLLFATQEFIEPSTVYPDFDISQPGSYIQWNLPPQTFQQILQDLQIVIPFLFDDSFLLEEDEQCFQPHGLSLLQQYYLNTHWKMLLIGEEGAGMFNHQDTLRSPTWQLLLQGVKQWHLCANSFTSYLYQAGEVNLFAPNYDNYPNVLKVKCYQFNQTAGDLLYYPGNYWHQTMNFETPTIGLTGTFITSASVKELIEELTKECNGAHRLFKSDATFCSILKNCFRSWIEVLQQDHEL